MQNLIELFPSLQEKGYDLSSPETPFYNCIAWAAGDTRRWWWPDPNDQYYWPPGMPRNETLEAFVLLFKELGYAVCEDAKYEEAFEKIAIYVDDSTGKPTHAARQVDSGRWTSKLGSLVDIEHDLNGVTGAPYGSVTVIMRRPKK
ncbi:MAG: hypothetical protein KKE57_04380 [Proteobacteria bacterium]|nr:hypothetical protein [Pseudomonadota bacterium]